VFRIFDRYLLKNFLVPFFLSLFGMIAIWLIYDLGENTATFQDNHLRIGFILLYYLTQMPYILVTWLPLAVLLGLLYVLTRMSRRNEIVSMLTAGVSVSRVLLPLILFGVLISGLCTYLNYELAPRGQYAENYMIDEVARGRSKTTQLDGHLFRNRTDHRTWFIQRLNTKLENIRGVQVTQENDAGTIIYKVYGERATRDPVRNVWIFQDGKLTKVDKTGEVIDEEYFERKEISGWNETIWQLGSSALKGKMMTVPQLSEYLKVNSDFPQSSLAEYRTQLWYRFALPWNAVAVILFASPICVVFSRRGALGGIAGGLFLFIGLFASTNVFLALGQGARISPILAAWAPAATFLLLGLVFLYLRTTNRPLPLIG
jgi:lipopolysaccharide export system permease protein